MLADRIRHHAALILLLVVAIALVFGSRYLGEYSSMSYMAVGAFIYLAIKALSDFKAANKAIYIRFEDPQTWQMATVQENEVEEEAPMYKEELFFKRLYDAALMEGTFAFAQTKEEIFKCNNLVVNISKGRLIHTAKSNRCVTVPETEAKAMMFNYSPVGGLLLFLHLSKRLRYLDDRHI